MQMKRGTRVVLLLDAKGAISGDEGKVSSRKKNGWLRVTIDRTHNTVSVRNGKDRVLGGADRMAWIEAAVDVDVAKLRQPTIMIKDEPACDVGVPTVITDMEQTIQQLGEMVAERDEWLRRAKSIITGYQARGAMTKHEKLAQIFMQLSCDEVDRALEDEFILVA